MVMTDREKVIEALEMSYKYSNVDENNTLVPQCVVLYAIALLKAQEPIRPNEIWQGNVLVYYQCSACTSTLLAGDKYCAWCGRKVKWE